MFRAVHLIHKSWQHYLILLSTFIIMSAAKKLCIVVGLGKGGIGDHLAKTFSSKGYQVAMVARSSLKNLEAEIPNSKSYQCDAGNPDQVSKTIESITKEMGGTIAALMYNVGSGVFKPFEKTSYEEFETSWRVGPAGVFLWTQTCLPFMKEGSSIGITGATASWRGMPYTPAFASSKMATRGMQRLRSPRLDGILFSFRLTQSLHFNCSQD